MKLVDIDSLFNVDARNWRKRYLYVDAVFILEDSEYFDQGFILRGIDTLKFFEDVHYILCEHLMHPFPFHDHLYTITDKCNSYRYQRLKLNLLFRCVLVGKLIVTESFKMNRYWQPFTERAYISLHFTFDVIFHSRFDVLLNKYE